MTAQPDQPDPWVRVRRSFLRQLHEQATRDTSQAEQSQRDLGYWAGRADGRAETSGYDAGYELGHDTSYGADTDPGRHSFLAGVHDGERDGTEQRQWTAQEAAQESLPKPPARQKQRSGPSPSEQWARLPEPELEREAG
jgi:hypothetical protein